MDRLTKVFDLLANESYLIDTNVCHKVDIECLLFLLFAKYQMSFGFMQYHTILLCMPLSSTDCLQKPILIVQKKCLALCVLLVVDYNWVIFHIP